MKKMGKGQASAELLIILAVSLAGLIAIYSFSGQTLVDLNKEKLVETAKNSVNSLKDAANDVFAQGAGAKKKILFIVPQGVLENDSGISGKSIYLNVFGTHANAVADMQLSGSLPVTEGGHWVWVTAHENYVFVGTENISVDKTSSYVTMAQNSKATDSITITNDGQNAASVTLLETWPHTDVTFRPSLTAFNLSPSQSQQVILTYGSGATAAGNYAGALEISATILGIGENISLPLNAEVTTAGETTVLAVFPATRSQTLRKGNTDNNSFQVCNNSATALGPVSFTASGTVGSWISAIASLSSLAAGNCETINYTLTVPSSQSIGTYTGSITASDGTNTDSLELTITIVKIRTVAFFTPSSGTDTTSGNSTLSSTDLTNISTSNDTYYTSQGNWPKNNAGYSTYVEFVFSPNIPADATIADANVRNEFAMTGAGPGYAKLQIWNGNSWTDETLFSNQTLPSSDNTQDKNVLSYIATPAAANGLKIRFLAYYTNNTNKKSKHDLLRFGKAYDI